VLDSVRQSFPSILRRWSVSVSLRFSRRTRPPRGRCAQPLDGQGAEDLAARGPQRLAAVEDHKHAQLDVQATVHEVGEEVTGDGLVLRQAVPEPERDLDALGGDAERYDAAAALELDPVEHQGGQADVVEAAAHERHEVLAGAPDDLAADRRLRQPSLRFNHPLADGLSRAREASRGDAREHLLQHNRGQRIAVGKVRVRLERHLARAVGRSDPRGIDRHAPAAERYLAASWP